MTSQAATMSMVKRTSHQALIVFSTHARSLRENTKLARRVSEEANLSLAVLAIFTSFSSIARRVKPALKHTMSELTAISTATTTTSKLRTNGSRVMVLPGVSPASFFTGVGKRAVSPVMTAAASAATDLELIHAKIIRGVRIHVLISNFAARMMIMNMTMITINGVIIMKEVMEVRLIIRRHNIVRGILEGFLCEEEFPWRDFKVFEGFLVIRRRRRRKELVGGIKLVLISTNGAHFSRREQEIKKGNRQI